MTEMNILSIDNLTKSYGRIHALQGLSLDINQGQVFGLLGPNGSGKTTTLGIILGIIRANKGIYAWFGGQYGPSVRTRLGAILETPNFYPYLNADDNLNIVRHIKRSGERDFDAILELVDLKKRRKSKFAAYSLGMRQRLAIAAAMVGDPEVLILDEPTNGLDPEGISDVRNIIVHIAEAGKTIIMASHMLDEVEKICTHVAILKNGQLLTTGPVGAILSDDSTLILQSDNIELLETTLGSMPKITHLKKSGPYLEITMEKGYDPAILNRDLMAMGIALNHLVVKKHSLESEFLEIVNK